MWCFPVLGSVLHALHILVHLILAITLWGRCCIGSYFTGEAAWALRGEVIFLRTHSWEVGSQYQSQAVWPWNFSSRLSANRSCRFYSWHFIKKYSKLAVRLKDLYSNESPVHILPRSCLSHWFVLTLSFICPSHFWGISQLQVPEYFPHTLQHTRIIHTFLWGKKHVMSTDLRYTSNEFWQLPTPV